ncbi:MAG: DUF3168 domain-containing protein [Hyphomicrobium sp.]|nr:DUF3168 domain-containing protein [Hyphomicrobium sp.]
MASASWVLQQAIYQALTNDGPLVALLGAARVWDDVPERAAFPYVTFAAGTERDWSTGGEAGAEHAVTLHVFSRAGGRKEAQEIIAALRAVLHEAALTLTGQRLINLRHEASDVRRDADGETYHGIVRFRAVTEPAP